jgi:hypothetical protein
MWKTADILGSIGQKVEVHVVRAIHAEARVTAIARNAARHSSRQMAVVHRNGPMQAVEVLSRDAAQVSNPPGC